MSKESRDYFTKTELIQERHWNKTFIKRLLPDPYFVQLPTKQTSTRWPKDVVLQAEKDPSFVARVEGREIEKAAREKAREQASECLIDSAAAAYRIDIRRLDIRDLRRRKPLSDCEEFLSIVSRSMRSVEPVLAENPLDEWELHVQKCHLQVAIKKRLLHMIADAVPSLAFEAGLMAGRLDYSTPCAGGVPFVEICFERTLEMLSHLPLEVTA